MTKTIGTPSYKYAEIKKKKKKMDMDALVVILALTTWPHASNCNDTLD